MKKELDYLSLAKRASSDGNGKLVWFYLRQQARIMRKKMTPVTSRSQG